MSSNFDAIKDQRANMLAQLIFMDCGGGVALYEARVSEGTYPMLFYVDGKAFPAIVERVEDLKEKPKLKASRYFPETLGILVQVAETKFSNAGDEKLRNAHKYVKLSLYRQGELLEANVPCGPEDMPGFFPRLVELSSPGPDLG